MREAFPSEVQGREMIPTASANAIQIKLMLIMYGIAKLEDLLESDGEHFSDEINEKFMEWMANHGGQFASYCDKHATDEDLINRIKADALTSEDYQSIINYFNGQTELKEKG